MSSAVTLNITDTLSQYRAEPDHLHSEIGRKMAVFTEVSVLRKLEEYGRWGITGADDWSQKAVPKEIIRVN